MHGVTKSRTRLSASTTTHTYGRGSPVTLGSFYFLPLLGPSTWGGKHRSLSRKPAWGVKVLPGHKQAGPCQLWPTQAFGIWLGRAYALTRVTVSASGQAWGYACRPHPPHYSPLLQSQACWSCQALRTFMLALSPFYLFIYHYYYFFWAVLCSLWDRTQDHHSSERTEPQPLDHWRIPTLPILWVW